MWGQDSKATAVMQDAGIIPTRVGTRLADLIRFLLTEDHPHACGDKRNIIAYYEKRRGSSPRVWGQAEKTQENILLHWIIPTRVGTSFLIKANRKYLQDHPHACGDKYYVPFQGMVNIALAWTGCIAIYYGIIPTRVGTRNADIYILTACQDHPHACGDKL